VILALLLAAAVAPDCSLAPGWKQHGAARIFVADNLFEYMNGNAEGYLIYGFQRMAGVTCESGGETLVFDISEMADEDGAYGMFTANRDPNLPTEKIGMGGQVLPRRATFAKGRYYVEIAANAEKDSSQALRAFATAMEKRLTGSATLPAALSWFPAEQQQSIRLVPESVLGLRVLKRGYVAQYDYGKAFLVLEASPEAAAGVLAKLKARFGGTGPVDIGEEAFQFEDKYLGRLAAFRKGRYVGGWANVGAGQEPAALARRLAERLP